MLIVDEVQQAMGSEDGNHLLQALKAARADSDEHLPVTAATLRATSADMELASVETLGPLATAIFERIAQT